VQSANQDELCDQVQAAPPYQPLALLQPAQAEVPVAQTRQSNGRFSKGDGDGTGKVSLEEAALEEVSPLFEYGTFL